MSVSPKMIFRLLEDDIRESAMHFSVEEAILRGVNEGTSPPTLRMRRSEKAVWIGVHQKVSEEVDRELCLRLGIPIVRRHNPGGAVYQDSGSLCFTCTFRKDAILPTLGLNGPEGLYPLFGRAIARTGQNFGASIAWSPVNDATISGRKVFGSAQILHYEALSHSGSLLVDVDLDTMAKVLRPPAIKFSDKNASCIRDRVVNLSEACGRKLDPADVSKVLSQYIAEELNIELVPSGLTKAEQKMIDILYHEKYGRYSWTFSEERRIGKVAAAKCSSGVVTLEVRMQGEIIDAVEISGDFLAPDRVALDAALASLAHMTLPAAEKSIRQSVLPLDLRNTIAELLEKI